MQYHTEPDHPNVNDNPNGLAVYWSDMQPEEIEVIAWTNYSCNTGRYNATLARFSLDKTNKTILLERVSSKQKFSPWDEGLTNPARYVSDKMKRAVRDFVAKDQDSTHWRVQV